MMFENIIYLIMCLLFLLHAVSAWDFTKVFMDEAVETFSVGSNATIIQDGQSQDGCKFLHHNLQRDITCCYSNKPEDLCLPNDNSCRSPETAIVNGPPGRCELLLVNIQESDEGEFEVIFPGHLPDNVKNYPISVTQSREEPQLQPGEDIYIPEPKIDEAGVGQGSDGWILAAVIGWVGFGICLGYIIYSNYKSANDQVARTEETDLEVQRPLQGVVKTVKKIYAVMRPDKQTDQQTEVTEVPLTSVETIAPSSLVQPSTA